VVNRIITDIAVFDVRPQTDSPLTDYKGAETRLELIEIADGVSLDDVKAATGATFAVSSGLKPMMQEPADLDA